MKVNYQNQNITLPNFFIVGAPKSGTTSIYYYLKKHENFFFPELKEPHFFTLWNTGKGEFKSPDALKESITDLEKYLLEYKGVQKDKKLGDASQSYLYSHEQVIQNMKQLYGEEYKHLKILIFLRNPIDRAWSQYWHFSKNFFETLPFLETIKPEVINERINNKNWNIFYDYIGFGKYCEQIQGYQEHFDNVKIFLFEDLKNQKEKVVKETLLFLGESGEVSTDLLTDRVYNQSGKPKKSLLGFIWILNKKYKLFDILKKLPFSKKFKNRINYFMMERVMERQKMPDEVREKLKEIYKPEILRLSKLINRKEVLNWLK